MMTELQTINFNGTEIATVENGGIRYIAMKPIVEAMGLEWKKQQELIKRDPVLSSVTTITGVTARDGKTYQTVCLPLEYLNGWLFKVPAGRYSGERRKTIELYQRECYRVLYHHFNNHNAALPPPEVLMEELRKEMQLRIKAEAEVEQHRIRLENLSARIKPCIESFGKTSAATGLPRDIIVTSYSRSDSRRHKPDLQEFVQLVFNFRDGEQNSSQLLLTLNFN